MIILRWSIVIVRRWCIMQTFVFLHRLYKCYVDCWSHVSSCKTTCDYLLIQSLLMGHWSRVVKVFGGNLSRHFRTTLCIPCIQKFSFFHVFDFNTFILYWLMMTGCKSSIKMNYMCPTDRHGISVLDFSNVTGCGHLVRNTGVVIFSILY